MSTKISEKSLSSHFHTHILKIHTEGAWRVDCPTISRCFTFSVLFSVTTPTFLLLSPSFLKGHQMTRRCNCALNTPPSEQAQVLPFNGDPLGCPIKEVSDSVEKMNGLGSRNKTPNNHPSVIKIQRLRPTQLVGPSY